MPNKNFFKGKIQENLFIFPAVGKEIGTRHPNNAPCIQMSIYYVKMQSIDTLQMVLQPCDTEPNTAMIWPACVCYL